MGGVIGGGIGFGVLVVLLDVEGISNGVKMMPVGVTGSGCRKRGGCIVTGLTLGILGCGCISVVDSGVLPLFLWRLRFGLVSIAVLRIADSCSSKRIGELCWRLSSLAAFLKQKGVIECS